MNRGQKLKNIIIGVLMVLCGLLMLLSPDDGYRYVFLILTVTLFVTGISKLCFYFSMARLMVGGRRMLYEGIICLDFGFFAISQMDAKRGYVIVYMVLGLLFWSGIGIIRALEQRKFHAAQWKRTLVFGALGIVYTIACLFGARYSANLLALAYIIGMISSGIGRIASAFRKTAIPEIPL